MKYPTIAIVSLTLAATTRSLVDAFSPTNIAVESRRTSFSSSRREHTSLFMSDQQDELEKTFGGYTAKQRLREEVESPFRTFRLFFFGSSTGSALVALYFSFLTVAKSTAGFADAPPLNEALQSVGINVAALLICGGLTYRDWKAGEANLARIKQGGALAKLVVERQDDRDLATLADYRRSSRVLIAAGGRDYISQLCRSLNSDQLADANVIPQAMASSDLILVPVLLEQANKDQTRVGDTASAWLSTKAVPDIDRNFDVTKASSVVAFPRGPAAWAEVLKPEVNTATGQGFDVLEKGITLILKKNGKILRRATGQPQWNGLLGTMEVLDGSKFGMPGDDEIYGAKGKKSKSASSN